MRENAEETYVVKLDVLEVINAEGVPHLLCRFVTDEGQVLEIRHAIDEPYSIHLSNEFLRKLCPERAGAVEFRGDGDAYTKYNLLCITLLDIANGSGRTYTVHKEIGKDSIDVYNVEVNH